MAKDEDMEEKEAQAKDMEQGKKNLADEDENPGPLVIPRMLYEAGKIKAKEGIRSIKRHWEHR